MAADDTHHAHAWSAFLLYSIEKEDAQSLTQNLTNFPELKTTEDNKLRFLCWLTNKCL